MTNSGKKIPHRTVDATFLYLQRAGRVSNTRRRLGSSLSRYRIEVETHNQGVGTKPVAPTRERQGVLPMLIHHLSSTFDSQSQSIYTEKMKLSNLLLP